MSQVSVDAAAPDVAAPLRPKWQLHYLGVWYHFEPDSCSASAGQKCLAKLPSIRTPRIRNLRFADFESLVDPLWSWQSHPSRSRTVVCVLKTSNIVVPEPQSYASVKPSEIKVLGSCNYTQHNTNTKTKVTNTC